MGRWLHILGATLLLAIAVSGNEVELVSSISVREKTGLTQLQKQDDASRQRCSGMYSRKSWGGTVDPFILIKFIKNEEAGDSDPLASLVIFEWQDEALIGRYPPNAQEQV